MHHVAPISFIAPLVGGGYVIEGSGLFDRSGSGHLAWTPSGSGDNTDVVVLEVIFKLGSMETGTDIGLLGAGTTGANPRTAIEWNNNALTVRKFNGSTNDWILTMSGLIYDYSAFYHLIVAIDTSQGVASDRVKVWLNGTQVSDFSTETYPSLNADTDFATTDVNYIGRTFSGTAKYFDGCIARAAVYDNLTITDPETDGFGTTVGNGWQINDISGLTFGTNGFLIEGGTNMAAGTDSHTTGSATSTFTASSTAYQAGAPTNWAGNFDGISIGTASADRVVVVAISGNNGSTGVPSAVTIAGNSATLAGSTYVGGESDSSIWYATVATGTTADIDITYSSGKQSVSIGVYAITGCNPDPLDTSGSTTADTPSTTITAHSGSTLIACASHAVGSGSTTTWTGPTEDYDEDDAPTSDNCGFTSASADYSALQDEITVTASCDGTAATSSMACAVWEASGTNHFLKTGTITATNDSPTDDATNGYGNRATLNPLSQGGGSVCTGRVFSNGNREYQAPNTATEGDHTRATMTMPFPNDKLTYIEFRVGTNSTTQGAGVCSIDTDHNTTVGFGTNDIGAYDSSTQTRIYKDGVIVGSAFTPRIDTASTDLVCIAYNGSDGKVWIGTSDGTTRTWRDSSGTGRTSDEPGSGTNPTATLDTGIQWFAYAAAYDQGTMDALVDADDWVHTAPSGAVELSTENLPAPAITDWREHYYAEAGISHTNGATTDVTLPWNTGTYDTMVRVKRTDSAGDWEMLDTKRGGTKHIGSVSTTTEGTFSDGGFSGTTFSMSSDFATGTYLVEAFREGEWFQIVTYTGTGSAHAESFASTLSAPVGAMQVKNLDVTRNWAGYHISLGNTVGLGWDNSTTAAVATSPTYWNSTTPTTTQLTVGTSNGTNENTYNFVAYVWANGGPYAFGEYTGNLSTDGVTIYGGGVPRTLVLKKTSGTANWFEFDTARDADGNTGTLNELYLDLTNGASSRSPALDFLATGVKLRAAYAGFNESGGTFVYGMYGIQPFGGDGVEQARAR